MTADSKTSPEAAYANKGDLTTGPVRAHLIRLSIPMIWGIFAIISMQLADTFFISMLGTQALAAIGFTFPLTMAIFSFIMGLSIGTSSVLSRLIGAKDLNTAKRVTTHALLMAFLCGLILAFAGIILHDPIFRAMGAPENMLPLISDYMMIWFASAVFLALPIVGNAAIRAAGDSAVPALIMVIVALVNLTLDPIFIFGLFGFPRMEIFGAALATVIANASGAIAGFIVIKYQKKLLLPFYDLRLKEFANSCKRILFISIPAGITSAISHIITAFIIALLAKQGPEAVAAFSVVSRLEAFAFIILMAVTVGMGPIIGQNWGAKNYGRVAEVLKLAIGFNMLWSFAVAGIFALFARPLAELFSDDESVIEITILFFLIVPWSYAFTNLLRGWASAFNPMGQPQRGAGLIALQLIVLMLPAVYIGNFYAGITGIFIAMAAVHFISGIGAHLYSRYFLSCKGCEF